MTSSQTKEIRFEDQIFFPAQVDGDQLVYKNPDFQLVRRRYLNLLMLRQKEFKKIKQVIAILQVKFLNKLLSLSCQIFGLDQ